MIGLEEEACKREARSMDVTKEKAKARVALELSYELLLAIDGMKGQLGLRTRGEVVERLLHEVFFGDEEEL